jgi:ABC-2 type transport system ATP-binding protein
MSPDHLALNIKGVTKNYHNGVHALRGINLEVRKGDFFGLLGLNGAGKTTLISILMGLVRPTEGVIEICGADMAKQPLAAKHHISLMPQEININAFLTVKEVMFNHGGYYGLTRSEIQECYMQVLQDVGLAAKARRQVQSLSGGMKRRLLLARCLLVKPKVLVLDEPTAGVDVELRQEIWDLLQKINKQGTTILLTTHYMEEAEYLCQNLAVLHHGKIIDQGRKSELALESCARHLILHISSDVSELPQVAGIESELIDARSVSLSLTADAQLSAYLQALDTKGAKVQYVSSPTSRLEQYFRSQTGD